MKTTNTNSHWKNWAGIALLLIAHWCHADSYVVGVSEYYSEAQRLAVLKAVLQLALEGIAPGDKVVFYDALNLREITTLELPNEKLFDHNAIARARRFKGEMAKLAAFFVYHPHGPELNGVIDTPAFLWLASSQLRRAGEPLKLIILGSPIFMSKTEPAFNCQEAFPSDYHLVVSERESVWGTANRKRALSGVAVHFGYLPDGFVNDLHRERIGRFLCLYVKQMGGTLATFAPDLGLALQRARSGSSESCISAEIDSSDTKVEMRRVVTRTMPTWFPSTNQIAEALASANASAPAAGAATNQVVSFPVPDGSGHGLGIGIMWAEPRCDFDLWVSPKAGVRDLSFANTTSPEGKYFHDYRDKNEGVDYEYVELKEPGLDVSRVKAWVNFYEGQTAKPQGIVVVRYQGRTYQSTFSIQSHSGNKSAGYSQKKGGCWTEIPIAEILGLVQ